MFCIQCEQTKQGGCQTRAGNCGKTAATADLQDVLILVLQGISAYASRARRLGAADRSIDEFMPGAYFTTLTNVNFDDDHFVALIGRALSVRDTARRLYETACRERGLVPDVLPLAATWQPGVTREQLLAAAPMASLVKDLDRVGPTVTGLRELLLYGLKGCAAYAEHARVVGFTRDDVLARIHDCGAFLAEGPTDVGALVEQAMALGALNLDIMGLLDEAHTTRFGHPEVTAVRMTPRKGKAILVSGHDLVELEAVLKQTAGTGINVYTHGELLPANAYPALKAYPHLAGNYGGAWQDQQREFAAFPGAILMTSNCLINPETRGYADRLFTCGPVGWKGVRHIDDMDFSAVIARAAELPGFAEDAPEKVITTGFARNTVMSVADPLLDMIAKGDVGHIFLIGGCDGARLGRNYFHDLAMAAPDDSLILTLGCGKFRFNGEDLGAIGGIPRVLDMGQCNDAYSAIQVAVALAKALDCSVNDLPLSLAISWFEQKATAVLLTLLHLGVRNIHLGPTLPTYLTPEVLALLQDKFALQPTGRVDEDLPRMLGRAA
jgi:hydroxylamine reductase